MAETFDYIIVGAGSAGCVLADRLTRSGTHRVLLLEAGGTDLRFYVQMPLGYGKTFYDKSVNWMYRAEPDPGLNGQSDFYPRGRLLGGSSSINAMVYIRGHRQDYEDWRAAGNVGWGWNEVLSAYKAMENYAGGDPAYRGRGGPLTITDLGGQAHPLCKPFLEATGKAGLKFTPDFNGAEQEGVGLYQYTIKNGIRNSAARAFLRPAMKRRNLRVETHAQATRILFEGNRAVGVAYVQRGMKLDAKGRGIILAGGAINSPQLLQLSGIGPGALLHSLGIPVVRDNPNVGARMQDHHGVNYTWRMTAPTLNDELRPWWGKLKAGVQYILTRKGPLSLSINQGGGFFRTHPGMTRPNMQLYMQAFSTLIPRAGERPILNPDPFSGLSLGLSNCRPTSTGEVMISSADPLAHPRISFRAYSTVSDVEEMLAAVKFLRKIAAQEPLRGLMAEELRPGPAVTDDNALIDDFRQRSGTVYHHACTCRMGPDAGGSVVDTRLRVHGVEGLRVCDASVFPNLIAGNTNAPAMMVGWRGAEIMLEDARA
ncbi:GMC family oxidoreductase N-terminal domain-containing protein [Aestuariivirga sp.]|uniref:GMC family oxidoreductase n=1 Tax=Aestuariivirga sp. TaxID=2650926 RepID=UPI0025C3F495|nr:GMC family oxidoreductase N-terminal domain-containing protein [Aestuariivirga sp.]MCA3556485.1 GMC family oxidoreductase N-terminal domain-containing protein [Aestuariivirga sp.]